MTDAADAGALHAAAAPAAFPGDSEMARRCRGFDWAATSLGPVEHWPQSLRTVAAVVLAARQPMFLWWGPDLVQLYNDAYSLSLGADRHPAALGARGRDFWADAWPVIGPDLESILAGGPAVWYEDRLVPIVRDGRVEDVYWTYGYTPVPDDAGRVSGVLVTVTETTARVRTRAAEEARSLAAFTASEARFRTVQDASPIGFCIHRPVRDADGAVVDFVTPYINAAGARIVGQPPERVTSERLLTIWPMAGVEGIVADYARVLATGAPNVRELLYEHEELAAGLTLTAVRIGDGPDAELGITFTDVTQRLRADRERARLVAELAAERERLRAVILHMPAPLGLAEGPEHRFALVNDAFKRASGGGRDVTGLTPREAFPELAGQGIHELFDRVYATGDAWVGRETLMRYDRDGTGAQDTWYDLRYEPVRDADGRVTGVLNFAVDVTEQVRARREVERLLADSEAARGEAAAAAARAEAVLASIADAFYLLDHDWRFTYVNAAAEPLLQTTAAALLGRTLWEAFPEVAGSVFEGPYREAMATGRVTAAEAFFAPLDTWFDVRSYPWAGGLMVHFRDVGARKAAEAERERLLADAEAARREAEAANRAKSEFLAVMSHELRTPLNAIGGYAELMAMGLRGPITPQQREDLRRVQASQRHLLGLINEVLNYAKLETGAVHYDVAPTPVRDALTAAEALVAPQAHAKGLTLAATECPPELTAQADAEKLRQILVNLLSNAVKFTDAGGSVELACADLGERVQVTVRDTGIGIAADQLERIFDPFVQVRAGLTRPHEGTGLGLAISRDLARGMGGELSAESVPGAGSTFVLTLPRA